MSISTDVRAQGQAAAPVTDDTPVTSRQPDTAATATAGLSRRLSAAGYMALNITSAVLVVFTNKYVLSPRERGGLGFSFTFCLTFLHSIATVLGMSAFSAFGLYEVKELGKAAVAPLACSYVGYIVLSNLNLKARGCLPPCRASVCLPCRISPAVTPQLCVPRSTRSHSTQYAR